jgi:tRNA G18 (ribose-2'-O)-methylase SpoU
MDGDNIYKSALPQEGILIMGNEANGISVELEKLVQKPTDDSSFWSSSKNGKS